MYYYHGLYLGFSIVNTIGRENIPQQGPLADRQSCFINRLFSCSVNREVHLWLKPSYSMLLSFADYWLHARENEARTEMLCGPPRKYQQWERSFLKGQEAKQANYSISTWRLCLL